MDSMDHWFLMVFGICKSYDVRNPHDLNLWRFLKMGAAHVTIGFNTFCHGLTTLKLRTQWDMMGYEWDI